MWELTLVEIRPPLPFVQRIYFTLLILNYRLHFNVWPTLILSTIYMPYDISNCWPSSGRLSLRAFHLFIYTIIWDISTHCSLYVIYKASNCYLFPDMIWCGLHFTCRPIHPAGLSMAAIFGTTLLVFTLYTLCCCAVLWSYLILFKSVLHCLNYNKILPY